MRKNSFFNFNISKLKHLALLIGLIFAIGTFKIEVHTTPKNYNATLQHYADQVVLFCSPLTNHAPCYDAEIPKLMDSISMEDAFKVLKLVQQKDDTYWFCHGLGHALSAKEFHRDPTKWRDIMTRVPVGVCSNGGLHGALQEHFSSSDVSQQDLFTLLPDLQNLCERRNNWNPTPQQQSSCYHELGHLSMFLTKADPNRSGYVCESVGIKSDGRNYLQTCYEGIFMQLFEPREPDDFSLIYEIVPSKNRLSQCEKFPAGLEKGACWKIGWRDNYSSFCDQFKKELKYACFREAWVINDDQLTSSQGVIKYCNYSDEQDEKKLCYDKLYYALMAVFQFDIEKMKPICNGLPQDLKGQCFADAASRMIETDHSLVKRAVEFCEYSNQFGVAKECYQQLASQGSFFFQPNSSDSKSFCQLIPDQWRNQCTVN